MHVYQTSRRHVQKYSNIHSHRREKRKSHSSSIYQVENSLMRNAAHFVPVLNFKRGAMTVGEAVEVQLHAVLVLILV